MFICRGKGTVFFLISLPLNKIKIPLFWKGKTWLIHFRAVFLYNSPSYLRNTFIILSGLKSSLALSALGNCMPYTLFQNGYSLKHVRLKKIITCLYTWWWPVEVSRWNTVLTVLIYWAKLNSKLCWLCQIFHKDFRRQTWWINRWSA